ncbi:MAG: FKBP-type peptidyl-prolyl cis-trans isomerase [Naasia sp.]
MRTLAAVAAFGVLGLGLSACTTGNPGDCIPETTSGSASSTVSAPGDLGTAPEIEFPTPLISDGVQTTTLIEGDGPVVEEGQYVLSQVTILNGSTGESVSASAYDETNPTAFLFDQLAIPGLADGIKCQTAGSRVAVTLPGEVAFPDGGTPQGMTTDDSLVVVMDVVDSITAHAHGTINASQSGFPSVVRAVDGRPGITFNGSEPPTEFGVSTLIAGDGEGTVAEGDDVLLQYTGVVWNGETPFDSSWENGAPATLTASEDSVIPGFARALVGATVGDQLVVVIPPDLGYGDDEQGAIPAGSTLVFVIDVLAIP